MTNSTCRTNKGVKAHPARAWFQATVRVFQSTSAVCARKPGASDRVAVITHMLLVCANPRLDAARTKCHRWATRCGACFDDQPCFRISDPFFTFNHIVYCVIALSAGWTPTCVALSEHDLRRRTD